MDRVLVSSSDVEALQQRNVALEQLLRECVDELIVAWNAPHMPRHLHPASALIERAEEALGVVRAKASARG